MGSERIKRHALMAGGGRLLWVGNDADWALMRSASAPKLVCPQVGCADPLHPVLSAGGTRFLRWSRGAGGCPHWLVGGQGGGPESAQHLWFKARLASICLGLGWAAVPEDPRTRADVWVPDARTAFEVQLRRSDLLARTHARLQAGAQTVVWFISADVAVRSVLFRTPAVRIGVVSASDRTVRPWDEGVPDARLVVFGTVWRWRDWRLDTGALSAYTFLADVLAGRMGWCPPGTAGLPGGRGGWIRWTDLAVSLGVDELGNGLRADLRAAPAAWIAAELERRTARRAAG